MCEGVCSRWRSWSLVGLTLSLACGGSGEPGSDGGVDSGVGIRSDLPPFVCSSYEDCPSQPGGADDSMCTEIFPGGACLLDSRATCDDTTCPTGSECTSFLGELHCLRTCALGCKVGQMCGAEGVCVPANCTDDETVCGPYPCMKLGPTRVCTRIFCSSESDCPAPFVCNPTQGVCEEPRYTSPSG